MDRVTVQKTTDILRYVLTAQLVLGGQARLTSALTPGAYHIAMSKAEDMQRHLSIIPIRDAKRHSSFMGVLMCTSGLLLCARPTRLAGAVLSAATLGSWVYAFYRMRAEWWLPAINTAIAGLIVYGQTRM